MQNLKFVVIDIGSGKLRLSLLAFEDDGSLKCKKFIELDYAGFCDGEFVDDDFETVCAKLFEGIDCNEINSVFVNVPTEFCGQITKNITMKALPPIDLKGKTKNDFLKYAMSPEITNSISEGVVINTDILDISYESKLQSNNYKSEFRIDGLISYIFIDKFMFNKFSVFFKELGFTDINYTCSINTQALYLLPYSVRKSGAVLIDIGFLSTSVAVVKNDGVKRLRSFSLGGGHMSAYLAEHLKIPFSVADNLRQKVLLSMTPSDVDYYVVSANGKDLEFQASFVNKIIYSYIEQFANMINKCISSEDSNYKFYITGGALTHMNGAVDVLSKEMNVSINMLSTKLFDFEAPEHSAIVSLINYASNYLRRSHSEFLNWKNLWETIKSWFNF